MARGNTLGELAKLGARQYVPQFGLTHHDDLEQFALIGFQVGQQPYLLQRVFTHDTVVNYRGLFLVPLAAATLGALALAFLFHPPAKQEEKAAMQSAVTA